MTKAEHLFTLLGDLDDDLVEEAACPAPAPRRLRDVSWKRWGALCACLLLAAGLWNLTHIRMGSSSAPPDVNATSGGNSGASTEGDPVANAEETPGGSVFGSSYGTLIAEDSAPDGQPCRLYYRASDGQWTLTHGEYAADFTSQMSGLSVPDDSELSDLVYLSVNGCLEGEFYPAEHVSFENYVLIAFLSQSGPSACLVVGINADGSLAVDEALYWSCGE